FSTLHTNSAPETVTRLLDMGLNPLNFSDAFLGVLAQRLIRRVCRHCAAPHEPDINEQAWLRDQTGDSLGKQAFVHGSGCNNCNHTGYDGRIGVYELLIMDAVLAAALRGEDQNAFEQAARAQAGYVPLLQNALDYARRGITTIGEVIRLCGWAD
ncbi:MAG: ATPase, T2SS/T4P/T4SS family, partial [Thiohalobacterales bacterium]|nr:ATPase, T2SS/T4P/T4SS family [Thiohalobacterales bacterium]